MTDEFMIILVGKLTKPTRKPINTLELTIKNSKIIFIYLYSHVILINCYINTIPTHLQYLYKYLLVSKYNTF